MKPTTIENQVVLLSFGSSQFVSFVDSRNRTHDENVAPTGPKIIQQKNKKSFLQTRKVQKRRTSMAENTAKVWEKLKESSKGSNIIGKTDGNTQIAKICFQYKQTSRVDLT